MSNPAGEFEEAAKRLDAKAFRYGSLTPGVKHGVNITDAKTILRQALNRQAKAHLADKEKAVRKARLEEAERALMKDVSFPSINYLDGGAQVRRNALRARISELKSPHQLDEDGNDNP